MATEPSGRGRVIRIFASQWLLRVARLAVPLILTPFALKTIGTRAYGAWLLAGAVAGYASQNFGIPQVLVDVTAAAIAHGDRDRISAFFKHALVALLVPAALALALARPLAGKLDLGSPESSRLVWLALATTALALPLSAARGVADGLQETHRFNVATSIAIVGSVPLAIWGLSSWPSPLWLFVPTIATSVLADAVMFVRMWRRHPWLTRAKGWSAMTLRNLLGRGGLYIIIGVAWTIIYGTDIWIIDRICGHQYVAPYGIIFSLFNMLGEPVGVLVMALRPVAARLGAGGATGAAQLLLKTTRLSTVLGLVLSGAGLLWYRVVMDVWVGATVGVDFRIGLMLALFQALRAVLNASAWILTPVDGPRPLALALTGDAVINLGLSIALAKLVGPWGVAAGSFIGMALCSGWYVPFRARELFGVSPVGRWILPAMLGAAPLWIAALLFRPSISSFQGLSGFALLAAGLLATLVLSAFLVLMVGLESPERLMALTRLREFALRGTVVRS